LLNSPWTSEARDKDEVGRHGERVAARWLRARGCRVLYRNCRDRDVLAFVEVKTRTSTAFGRPAQAVTIDKQALILRGATAWLKLLGCPEHIKWRYDVIEVLLIAGEKPRVNWIRAAFNTDELAGALARRRRNRM
jgi:putative endonuclease